MALMTGAEAAMGFSGAGFTASIFTDAGFAGTGFAAATLEGFEIVFVCAVATGVWIRGVLGVFDCAVLLDLVTIKNVARAGSTTTGTEASGVFTSAGTVGVLTGATMGLTAFGLLGVGFDSTTELLAALLELGVVTGLLEDSGSTLGSVTGCATGCKKRLFMIPNPPAAIPTNATGASNHKALFDPAGLMLGCVSTRVSDAGSDQLELDQFEPEMNAG